MDLDPSLDTLDKRATLAAVEGSLVTRRAAEARDLALAAHWADLHASDPYVGHGHRRHYDGQDRLVQLGGDGTPLVQELCLSELAVARRVHHHSARAAIADALDLRHRLPRWWAAVQRLDLEPWVARKVAVLSRVLDEDRIHVVDQALPLDLGEVSPARILEVVRAKVIEADPERHRAELAAEKKRRYVSLGRIDDLGFQHVIARIRAGDVVWLDALLERVADRLSVDFPPDTTRDVLRSEAFGWLARPEELLALLHGDEAVETRRPRSRAVLYVHLSLEAIRGQGVARVEEVGPVLASEIPEWLRHAHVTVRPVIDVAEQVAFDAYEHPGSVEERIHLRSPADCFPHANRVTRHLDLDHVEPYTPGRRGQTGDHNCQPLARTSHRAKTHGGHRVRQLAPGVYEWETPHGLRRRVDQCGTTVLPPGDP